MPKKRSSSKAWLREHHDDEYVLRARAEGYRSRACYKLLELQDRDKLIRPGMTVVDLGSAPGGWSQVAANLVGHQGRVIASDILPMDSLAGVAFIQGDFTEDDVFQRLLSEIGEESKGGEIGERGESGERGAVEERSVRNVDLVISDMAPNISGMSEVDQPRSMYLVELALDFSFSTLKPGGGFVAKVFQGEGFDALLASAREGFETVHTRKPAASRPRSREVYLVARGLKRR